MQHKLLLMMHLMQYKKPMSIALRNWPRHHKSKQMLKQWNKLKRPSLKKMLLLKKQPLKRVELLQKLPKKWKKSSRRKKQQSKKLMKV